ncbi:hypothetical protein K450DRAFT_229905 [Umbelopsis ramanniana AG]|uniref:Uncharacterized protein n=1 Tax=Umbelopsis ramanniana AG TaxID=1314678 RepID=A0AAD5EGM6_UMBRA|nr:uncharacterized protein K450DRAFT_229905 [Umbelopsis ramanniana AG]KAI8581920.1 hypothetical protein K450DRAFT_229905 [Umbelopsis ramanniana AG]
MRTFSSVTLFAAAAFVGSQISSVVAGGGQTVEIVNSSNFCFFLPPPGSSDMNISDNEGDAVAYCKGSTPKVSDSNTFPSGFILSAHVVTTSDYIQVTGQIDPTKAGLNANDDGGQYDIMAPKGATCAGYAYFVNLVEPSGNDYCIRCCNTETNCNRGISQDGCARVVPGDYSGPGVDSSSDSTSSTSSAQETKTTTTEAAAATTTSDPTDSTTTTTADDSSSTTSSVDAAASALITSSVPASSSVVPSTSVAIVSASSSSSIGIATTNLPTESVSAQSVNAAISTAPITFTTLALGGGIVALMQFI